MICSRCSAESPSGQKFCGECGAALALVCSSCGTASSPGQRFCGECGAALAVAARPGVLAAASAGPVAERRVCSVLFCDVVGFTPLSEARDPEAVRELLSGYFGMARTVVGRYGGVVEKFIGDAVMAVWGTPVAAEGDAERAVRAALDLVAAVTDLGTQAGVPGLAARCGVVTGEVAVTLGAAGEGMVAGDAVNTAARVQAAAQPGQKPSGWPGRPATPSSWAARWSFWPTWSLAPTPPPEPRQLALAPLSCGRSATATSSPPRSRTWPRR
jgi:hypothetical protein